MKKIRFAFAASFADSVSGRWETEKMAFAYLQSRHGARAPTVEGSNIKLFLDLFLDDVQQFKVGNDMLTAQGMRQRYLKGRKNRERYIEQYFLLSPEYVPGEIYI